MPTKFPSEAQNGYRHQGAFAAINDNGLVEFWGRNYYKGDSSMVADEIDADTSPRVSRVFSTGFSFTAVCQDD